MMDPAGLPTALAAGASASGRWWTDLDRGWQATVLAGLLVAVVAT